MNTHRITRALAALVVAGALVSCAADAEPPAAGEREGKGKAAHQKRADRKHGHQHGAAKPGQARNHGNGVKSGKPVQAAGGGATGSTGSTKADGGPVAQPVSRPSCTTDASGDTESSGAAPSSVDVSRGCLRTNGSQLRLEASALGAIPARMPDRDTHLSYGFTLMQHAGSTIYVDAQATTGGWTAYVSRGHGQREVGAPAVHGDRIVLLVPLAELGDTRRLQWTLESSWLQSRPLSTSYSFDSAPNGGAVRFDR